MKRPALSDGIAHYLATRRALGYQLKVEERLLHSFAEYAAKQRHAGALTCGLIEGWARHTRRPDPYTWARRLSVIRPFARFLAATDPATQVPGARVFGRTHRRLPPPVLTAAQLTELMEAARRLPSKARLPNRTLATLIGLLACTGLRVGEALRLRCQDVDLEQGLLQIRQTEFGKSRLVPLHPSVVAALSRYAQPRRGQRRAAPGASFFRLPDGAPVTRVHTRYAFERLRQQLGWQQLPTARRPTLRVLRHTFACQRLLAWYRQGVDVNQRVHALSTYLGHSKVSDTYWYLSGIPALLAVAGRRFRGFSTSEVTPP
jgi:integrase/recombinase XerD